MFARMTTFYLSEATSDLSGATNTAEILRVHERAFAALRKMKGFNNYFGLVNSKSGEATAIVFWETEQDMKSNRDESARLFSLIGAALGTAPAIVEEYEVAYHM